jgi:hypothetical protein
MVVFVMMLTQTNKNGEENVMQNQIEFQLEQYTTNLLDEIYCTNENSDFLEESFYIPELYEL